MLHQFIVLDRILQVTTGIELRASVLRRQLIFFPGHGARKKFISDDVLIINR